MCPEPSFDGPAYEFNGSTLRHCNGCGKTWKETTDETHEPDARSHVVDLSAAPPRRRVETG